MAIKAVDEYRIFEARNRVTLMYVYNKQFRPSKRFINFKFI